MRWSAEAVSKRREFRAAVCLRGPGLPALGYAAPLECCGVWPQLVFILSNPQYTEKLHFKTTLCFSMLCNMQVTVNINGCLGVGVRLKWLQHSSMNYQKSPQDVLKLCIYFIPLLTYNAVSHLFFGLEGFQFSIICCNAILYTSFYSQMQWLLL